MIRTLSLVALTALFSGMLFGQSPESAPKFEFADVHVSARAATPFPRNFPVRGGRYEIKTASMVDLIRTA